MYQKEGVFCAVTQEFLLQNIKPSMTVKMHK